MGVNHPEPCSPEDRLQVERLDRQVGAFAAEIKKILCCVDTLAIKSRIQADVIATVGFRRILADLKVANLPLIDLLEGPE